MMSLSEAIGHLTGVKFVRIVPLGVGRFGLKVIVARHSRYLVDNIHHLARAYRPAGVEYCGVELVRLTRDP